MFATKWVQFNWDLSVLPAQAPSLDKRYQFLSATEEDAELLEVALCRSFETEHAWSTELPERLEFVRDLVKTTLATPKVDFLVLKHGARIIAASGISEQHESQLNLLTGICVLNEYRCRGLGEFLLYQSLHKLKEKGVKSASVQTKKGVTAEKFLYPKFGGKRQSASIPSA